MGLWVLRDRDRERKRGRDLGVLLWAAMGRGGRDFCRKIGF